MYDAMRGQIAGVVHDVFVRQHFVLAEVVLASQVKTSGLFDIEGHGSVAPRWAIG
jgi:hypothetical protein